ncbi:663_t:CDS:2, partial [Entrophospora sp. SA101]
MPKVKRSSYSVAEKRQVLRIGNSLGIKAKYPEAKADLKVWIVELEGEESLVAPRALEFVYLELIGLLIPIKVYQLWVFQLTTLAPGELVGSEEAEHF